MKYISKYTSFIEYKTSCQSEMYKSFKLGLAYVVRFDFGFEILIYIVTKHVILDVKPNFPSTFCKKSKNVLESFTLSFVILHV